MKNDLIKKAINISLILINEMEDDVNKKIPNPKDKIDLINKLFSVILKLEKIKSPNENEKVDANDIRIINDFLEKHRNQKI